MSIWLFDLADVGPVADYEPTTVEYEEPVAPFQKHVRDAIRAFFADSSKGPKSRDTVAMFLRGLREQFIDMDSDENPVTDRDVERAIADAIGELKKFDQVEQKARKAVAQFLEERLELLGQTGFDTKTLYLWSKTARTFGGNIRGAYETGVFYEGNWVPNSFARERGPPRRKKKSAAVEAERD